MSISKTKLVAMIEHTLLGENIDEKRMLSHLDEAQELGVFGVCVPLAWVPLAKKYLDKTALRIITVIDFPMGNKSTIEKAHEAKLKQKVILVKEVKFRPGTDDGDYDIKLRNLKKFLDDGDKTKITLRFRGREMAHQDIGFRMLERLKVDLEPFGQVEQFPKMEGRQMIMILSPKKKK